jgi:hypothetical protein
MVDEKSPALEPSERAAIAVAVGSPPKTGIGSTRPVLKTAAVLRLDGCSSVSSSMVNLLPKSGTVLNASPKASPRRPRKALCATG